jgi:hypothetical protein
MFCKEWRGVVEMENRPDNLPEAPKIDTSRIAIKRLPIKKGTDDWWAWIALLKVAQRERRRLHLSAGDEVTINVDECNEYLQSLNLVTRFWLLLTIGDLHPVNRDKLGKEVAIKAEDGLVHRFFK